MMKTLCVAAVVLSLTSVSQPAPLACEKLLKPVDKGPDFTGSWYIIAISSENCWVSTLLNSFLLLSAQVDITPKDTANFYKFNNKIKIYGYCTNDSESFLYENNTIFDVDNNNAPVGEPDVLLQSGCPDCIVLQSNDIVNTLYLLSRRQTVTAAEMKEFEAQAQCLGWYKPQVLNTDHDFENCPSLDEDIDTSKVAPLISQRLKNTYTQILMCFAENFFHKPSLAFEWVQEVWDTLS